MPHHRPGSRRRRPHHRVDCLDALDETISEKLQVLKPGGWIKLWLLPNRENKNSVIPRFANVTFTRGLGLLFEMPYQAICSVVNGQTKASLTPFVAVSDSSPTDILVIDTETKRVVHVFRHKAWEFRFKSQAELVRWMQRQVKILKLVLREVGSDNR